MIDYHGHEAHRVSQEGIDLALSHISAGSQANPYDGPETLSILCHALADDIDRCLSHMAAQDEQIRVLQHVGDNGCTWYLRCGTCGELYVASSGWNMLSGKPETWWVRPRPKKKPTPCKHDGPVERWNGVGWVPVMTTQQRLEAMEGGTP